MVKNKNLINIYVIISMIIEKIFVILYFYLLLLKFNIYFNIFKIYI